MVLISNIIHYTNSHFQMVRWAMVPIIILFILPEKTTAQSASDYMLPPLDTIIALALKKSPHIKVQEIKMESRRKEIKLEKRGWANSVSIGGTALFGTNTVLDYQQTTTSSEQIAVDRRSAVYNGGVVARISIGDVINRDEKIHIKTLEYESAVMEREIIKAEVREEVIMRYNKFQASLSMLKLEVENVEAMRLAYEVSKKYFEEGNLAVSEYSTALSKYTSAKKLLEKAKMQIKHDHQMVMEMM